MSNKILLASFLGFSVALTGCSLAPKYVRPQSPVVNNWTNAPTQHTTKASNVNWQAFVVDAHLKDLIETALSNNRSLRQVLLDIDQARAEYGIQNADRLPTLNAGASGERQRVPGSLSTTGESTLSKSYQVGLSVPEYEIDLFGRVKSLSEAALEEYLATEEAGRSAQIALVAELTQTYVTYNGAQRTIKLIEHEIQSRSASLTLVSQQRSAGTASSLDYQEALGLVEQARTALESGKRQEQQALNALVLLIGTPDAELRVTRNQTADEIVLQEIFAGAPSDLIEQRPDILAAEHRLKAGNAHIGAAKAAFFPRVSLTGSLGTSSDEMSGLFNGGSRTWSFIPTVSVPIFDGGRNRANLDLAELRKDSAVASYEAAIQTAFREVADSLAANDSFVREVTSTKALARTTDERLRLAKARYEGGVDSHLRYLDAQRSHLANELSLITAETQRQLALVSLFRALGGGWGRAGV